jgi:wyosine [tRNA(Phe)-imidazoG37] synthetase (radical SAM superfamily)
VLAEIARALAHSTPDHITFVGDGEPTLSADIGWYVAQCKRRWSVPVAVITNGVLLFCDDVRDELLGADVVLPSLDAGDAPTFRMINRPHAELKYENVVAGLVEFSRAFKGQLRLEVMLVKGLNDSEQSLRRLRKLAWAIRPERIDVALPIRPPAEAWVMPPPAERILRAQKFLRSAETTVRPETGTFDIAGFTSTLEAVRGLSSRHPLRWDQAKQVEDAFDQPGELDRLIAAGRLIVTRHGKRRFVMIPPRGRSEN